MSSTTDLPNMDFTTYFDFKAYDSDDNSLSLDAPLYGEPVELPDLFEVQLFDLNDSGPFWGVQPEEDPNNEEPQAGGAQFKEANDMNVWVGEGRSGLTATGAEEGHITPPTSQDGAALIAAAADTTALEAGITLPIGTSNFRGSYTPRPCSSSHHSSTTSPLDGPTAPHNPEPKARGASSQRRKRRANPIRRLTPAEMAERTAEKGAKRAERARKAEKARISREAKEAERVRRAPEVPPTVTHVPRPSVSRQWLPQLTDAATGQGYEYTDPDVYFASLTGILEAAHPYTPDGRSELGASGRYTDIVSDSTETVWTLMHLRNGAFVPGPGHEDLVDDLNSLAARLADDFAGVGVYLPDADAYDLAIDLTTAFHVIRSSEGYVAGDMVSTYLCDLSMNITSPAHLINGLIWIMNQANRSCNRPALPGAARRSPVAPYVPHSGLDGNGLLIILGRHLIPRFTPFTPTDQALTAPVSTTTAANTAV